MEWSEITPGGRAETRSACDDGSTGKTCALQRFGDALAVGGALTELRCRARGDRRVETLFTKGNWQECIQLGMQ
jgi:hypothetical protein